jgi:hypothetical protein
VAAATRGDSPGAPGPRPRGALTTGTSRPAAMVAQLCPGPRRRAQPQPGVSVVVPSASASISSRRRLSTW